MIQPPYRFPNSERIRLHQQWWKRENTERLALIYTPLPHPYGGLDIDVPVGEIAKRKQANATVEYQAPKDVLVTACVDYATALIPAMLGAGFQNDRSTTWAIPAVHSILDVHIPPFDPAQPLFHGYLDRVKAVLAGWSWDTYLPANNLILSDLDPRSLCVAFQAYSVAEAWQLYEKIKNFRT